MPRRVGSFEPARAARRLLGALRSTEQRATGHPDEEHPTPVTTLDAGSDATSTTQPTRPTTLTTLGQRRCSAVWVYAAAFATA